jgi:hypothetical protein
VSPSYGSDEFLPWLRQYVEENAIRGVVPSEGLLMALRPAFQDLHQLLPLSPEESVVYAGMSKWDLFSTLRAGNPPDVAGRHLAPTALIDFESSEIPEHAIASLPPPLYVKADKTYARYQDESLIHSFPSSAEALAFVESLRSRFRKVLVQGHVPGMGVGVFLLRWNDRILAQFMNRHLHEVPHTGGWASLRDSWLNEEILADAVAKLDKIHWRGVAMMEYRWSPEGSQYHLIEMNGRFWASLHLDLHAGVDFPTLLMDTFFGREPVPVTQYPLGVLCRYTFPLEVRHVWSKFRDPDLSPAKKAAAIAKFAQLSIDPRVKSDMLFPGDRRLFISSVMHFLSGRS